MNIIISSFVQYHKKRVALLKRLKEEDNWGRLIYQIFFIGIESLAKVLYPKKTEGERFILLLSKKISEKEAEHLWYFWRNPLTHGGFLEHWTMLEAWNEDDVSFIEYPLKNKVRGNSEFTLGSIIEIYNELVDYFDNFHKERSIEKIEVKERVS